MLNITGATIVKPLDKTDRVTRSPRHFYQTQQLAFALQPFCIAPVLPGETLTNFFNEARLLSDPIRNGMLGWKFHQFLFYVKASDLLGDAIRDMFADPLNVDLAASQGIAVNDQTYYTAKGGVPYLELALKKITETYFRDEGEPWNIATCNPNVGGKPLPLAQIKEGFWMDSLTDKDLVPEQAEVDGAADTGDLERLLGAFEQLKLMGLANMDYEDYLRAHGISVDSVAEPGKPELVASWSEFMYPSNTVNPTDGTATGALSTVVKKGETSRKFFKEPGFIVGIQVARPKVYFNGLAGNLAAHMSRSWDWLPSWLHDNPLGSLKKFEPGTGPLGDRTTDTDGYFVDMADLLMHGDQLLSRGTNASGAGYESSGQAWSPAVPTDGRRHWLPLPDQSLNWKYPTQNMILSFFKDAVTDKQAIHLDGYVSFTIRGHTRERTPGSLNVTV
jgi:hypothetical protein